MADICVACPLQKGGGGLTVAAKVAVEGATFSFDKYYDYALPQRLGGAVAPGSIVLVPFGRGQAKPRIGVVLAVGPAQPGQKLKELYDAAPESAVLTDELLWLVAYLKEHTFCNYYEAVRAIIPYGAQYCVGEGPDGPILQKKLAVRMVPYYSLLQVPAKLTAKQQRVVELLQSGEEKTAAELCDAASCGKGVLDTMVKNSVLQLQRQEYLPSRVQDEVLPEEDVVLSNEQRLCTDELLTMLQSPQPGTALLHGVTGSGKTLVFLEIGRAHV